MTITRRDVLTSTVGAGAGVAVGWFLSGTTRAERQLLESAHPPLVQPRLKVDGDNLPAAEALEKLLAGNRRFVAGQSQHPHRSKAWRNTLPPRSAPVRRHPGLFGFPRPARIGVRRGVRGCVWCAPSVRPVRYEYWPRRRLYHATTYTTHFHSRVQGRGRSRLARWQTLAASSVSAAVEPVQWVKELALAFDDKEKRWWATFELSAWTDVEMSIVDPRTGTVVRHLAASVLGSKAPSPLIPNSRAQKIAWDGKDDFRAAVAKPEALAVRVRAGMSVALKRIAGGDPYGFYSREMAQGDRVLIQTCCAPAPLPPPCPVSGGKGGSAGRSECKIGTACRSCSGRERSA